MREKQKRDGTVRRICPHSAGLDDGGGVVSQ